MDLYRSAILKESLEAAGFEIEIVRRASSNS